MNRFRERFLSGILALMMISGLLCTAASAAVQSSEYLNSYSVAMTPDSNGKMVVTLDVSALDYMTKLGAKSISVYESTNGEDFYFVKTYYSSSYPKMMGSGKILYEDVLTHQGTAGRYYYATAHIYAGNSTGGDERFCDSAIKRARN